MGAWAQFPDCIIVVGIHNVPVSLKELLISPPPSTLTHPVGFVQELATTMHALTLARCGCETQAELAVELPYSKVTGPGIGT